MIIKEIDWTKQTNKYVQVKYLMSIGLKGSKH